MSNDLLVDFTIDHSAIIDKVVDTQIPIKIEYDINSKTIVIKQDNNGDELRCIDNISYISYNMLYDFETVSRYRGFRNKKQDPISCDDLTDCNAFKFGYMWNSLTGERIGIDPYGPLYISPVTILKTYFHSIMKGFWIEIPECLPIYGENLGCGEDFYIPGKGVQPEKYLFRLPIKDCYIYKDQDKSIHTISPKLTDDEIREIDKLIIDKWSYDPFVKKINVRCRSIMRIKKYYDIAISKTPTKIDLPSNIDNIYKKKVELGHIGIDHDTYLNRLAVDMIKELIGF
jgi:hypothetical protein